MNDNDIIFEEWIAARRETGAAVADRDLAAGIMRQLGDVPAKHRRPATSSEPAAGLMVLGGGMFAGVARVGIILYLVFCVC